MVAYGFAMVAYTCLLTICLMLANFLKKFESHARHYLISLYRIESYARRFFEQASI